MLLLRCGLKNKGDSNSFNYLAPKHPAQFFLFLYICSQVKISLFSVLTMLDFERLFMIFFCFFSGYSFFRIEDV